MVMTSTTSPTTSSALGRSLRSPSAVRTGYGRGAVLAAVDDSPLALPVLRRAAAVAAAENRELVLLTVVPSPAPEAGHESPPPTEDHRLDSLAQLAAAMTGFAVEPRVLVADYLARGGQRRQSRRVGATILRVARACGAAVIVVGLPDQERQRDISVSRRVAHGAPAAMRVALVTGADTGGPQQDGLLPAGPTVSRSADHRGSPVPLLPAVAGIAAMDAADRRQLAGRAQRLQSVELPRLRRALLSGTPLPSGTRAEITRRYETGLEQLRILQHLLDTTARY
ncbi:MAG: Universal stress protein family [Frankiales bacterium]|jgi:nucleotide-binding universal stress UspA family protein|nr:Universal stress protein family [Frankiales bacterium]